MPGSTTSNWFLYMIKSPSRFCIDKTIEYLTNKYCPKDRAVILDVGCGEGHYYQFFTSQGIKGSYFGIDIQQGPAWQEKREFRIDIAYSVYNAENLENLNRRFNFIISIQVLEHIRDDEKAIKGMSKCLEPGGKVLLTVPSKFSLLLYGPHGHRRYNLRKMRQLAEKSGFAVEEAMKIGGLCSFFLHFNTWTLPAIVLRLKIWRLYRKYTFLSKLIFKMEKAAYRLDKYLRVFESGYGVILKKYDKWS